MWQIQRWLLNSNSTDKMLEICFFLQKNACQKLSNFTFYMYAYAMHYRSHSNSPVIYSPWKICFTRALISFLMYKQYLSTIFFEYRAFILCCSQMGTLGLVSSILFNFVFGFERVWKSSFRTDVVKSKVVGSLWMAKLVFWFCF